MNSRTYYDILGVSREAKTPFETRLRYGSPTTG